MKLQKESDIQKAILQWLNLQPDTKAFKVHSTGIPIGTTGKFRKNHNKNTSDIIICKKGKFAAMEVKTETGKLTEGQREFLTEISHAGGYSCMVRSLDDAIEAFNEI